MQIKGIHASLTSIGNVREVNEDRVAVLNNSSGDTLLLVCDGMGGHQKGDIAAELTIDTIGEAFTKKAKFLNISTAKSWLKSAIKKTNKKVYKLANMSEEFHGMGTTIVAVLIKNDQYVVANTGDSRAYEITDKELIQLSEDQTYVEHLYRIGKITKAEALIHPKKHIITDAVGIFPTINLIMSTHKLTSKALLLCSDGLYNSIGEVELFELLNLDVSLNDKCEKIIERVNLVGGSDNSAIVLWEVEEQ